MKRHRIVLKNIIYMVKIVQKSDTKYFYFGILKCIVDTIHTCFSLVMPKILIDNMISKDVTYLIKCLIIFLLVSILRDSYDSWFSVYRSYNAKVNAQSYIQKMVFLKYNEIDQECFDNPEFYDTYVKALAEVDQRAINVALAAIEYIQLILNIMITMGAMLIINPIYILLTVCSVFISYKLQKKSISLYYKFVQDKTPIDRKRDYIKRVYYLQEYSKEMKIHPMYNCLLEKYNNETINILLLISKYYNKIMSIDYKIIVNRNISYILVTGGLVYQVLKGFLSIGDYFAAQNAVSVLNSNMIRMISALNAMNEHSLYIENFRNFMEYKSKIEKIGYSNTKYLDTCALSYELKNVSFKYSDNTVLNNINLCIKRGEKIAIVGSNGAGKSTLVKLLLRFYDVTEGNIYVNGTDIKEINLKSLRMSIGVVMQDFKYFAVKLWENILCEKNIDNEINNINTVLGICKLKNKVDKLPNGINTMISKEFSDDGVMFSGGEQQKIAIARSIVKSSNTLIFDEPSSALDPITEDEIMTALLTNSETKTVIMITHRLSFIKLFDRIVYLENGQIIEIGTHDELIAQNGKYALMYNTQMENYLAT